MQGDVRIERLTKTFGSIKALDRVSFSSYGGINIILGPNGAGKSTLLRCMMGLYKPDEGKVSVMGKDPYHATEIKQEVSMLSENYALYDYLTVSANLKFFGRLYGLSDAATTERSTEMLRKLNALEFLDRKVYTLSRGTKQKIAFCRAILNDPKILLLDEPTAFLDQQSSAVIRNLLLDYEKAGRTVIFVTQRINEVARYNARLLLINKGRIVKDSRTTDIYKEMLSNATISIKLAKPVSAGVLKSINGFVSANGLRNANMLEFRVKDYKQINEIISKLMGAGAYIASVDYAEPMIENLYR